MLVASASAPGNFTALTDPFRRAAMKGRIFASRSSISTCRRSLPPDAPEAVRAAQERYEHVASRYAEHVGRIEDAQAAEEAARAKDAQEAVQAAMEGGDISDVNRRERRAQAQLDALRRALPPVEQALDEAGDAMLEPIDAAAPSWAADLEHEAAQALARYQLAVEEALAALGEAERGYSAVDWLRAFHPAEARMGLAPGWHGKPMPLVAEDPWGNQEDPRELLGKAATASPRVNREGVRARREQEAREEREQAEEQARRTRAREVAERLP